MISPVISLVDWSNGMLVLTILVFVIIALIATLVIFMNSGTRRRP